MKLAEISDRTAWDEFVSGHAWGHPLQLWGWGEAKRPNWRPVRLALADGERWAAAGQVLLWRIPKLGRWIAYVPRGPVVGPGSAEAGEWLERVCEWARAQGVLYVRIEPAWTDGEPGKDWVRSKNTVQMSATYTLDLTRGDGELLEAMARKHRQYIRKAERDGVVVRRLELGADLAEVYGIYEDTAARARFGIHQQEYYERLGRELGDRSYLYVAEFESKAVAFLWLAAAGRTAYELYGGMNAAGQEVKANYFLKWRAVEEIRAAGYELYDFNGRVSEGVAQFKAGFGAAETDWIGTWDYPLNQGLYAAWERLWPVAKVVGRRVAKLRRS